MTSDTLKHFRVDRGFSQEKMADVLGISERALWAYEKGTKPVPKYVALACAAVAFGLPPMR